MPEKTSAVFIILGQSNAVGHGIPLKKEDIITEPLKNVYVLNRDKNQAYENTELFWSPFISYGTNLAEEQDHTYSIPYCLARLWQDEIDAGNPEELPDLYIIQIAIGAQGVTEDYMWYPQREKKLIPGKLGTVDIALFPFTMHIFSLLDNSFRKMGKEYEIIGLHWRGGEEDTDVPQEVLENTLEQIYHEIFDAFCEVLNSPPVTLHRMVMPDRMNDLDPSGRMLERMNYINGVFERLAAYYPTMDIFDMREAPHYFPDVRGNGIFIADVVHYTPESNRWAARCIRNRYVTENPV